MTTNQYFTPYMSYDDELETFDDDEPIQNTPFNLLHVDEDNIFELLFGLEPAKNTPFNLLYADEDNILELLFSPIFDLEPVQNTPFNLLYVDEDNILESLFGPMDDLIELPRDIILDRDVIDRGSIQPKNNPTNYKLLGKNAYVNREYYTVEGKAPLSFDPKTAFIDFVNNGTACTFFRRDNRSADNEVEDEDNPYIKNLGRFFTRILRIVGNDNYVAYNTRLFKYNMINTEILFKYFDIFAGQAIEGNYQYTNASDLDWAPNILMFRNYDEYTVEKWKKKVKKNNGKYFRYSHDSPFDLKKLQITHINDSKTVHDKINVDHCLISSLSIYFDANQIRNTDAIGFLATLQHKIGSNQFKTSHISKILPEWLSISVQKYEDDGKKGRLRKFVSPDCKKNKTKPIVEAKLFLFREHFMPQVKVQGNVAAIKDPKKFDKKKFTLASRIVIGLAKENRYTPCKYSYRKGIEVKDVIDHSIIEKEQREHQRKEYKSSNNKILFADYEAIVYNTPRNEHLPFMLGWIDLEGNYDREQAKNKKDLYQNTMIVNMFDKLINKNNRVKRNDKGEILKDSEGNVIRECPIFQIYFHNLKYDYHHIKKNKYLIIKNELERNGQIYSVEIIYKKRTFLLVDSMKAINEPLYKFNKMFALGEIKKMSFDLYNIIDLENFNKESIPLEKFKIMLKERENREYNEEDFKGFINHGHYYFKEHYRRYLKLDCETLMQGMKTFEALLKDLTGLSIYDSLTMSSLAGKSLDKEGCLDGTYSMTGNLQKYVMRSVTGGRVALRNNRKVIVNQPVEDFDAVSLYGSAMRLIKFCKGRAETITNLNIKYIMDNYQQFVITCKIKINKSQQIPMISCKDENGVRSWSNDVNEYIEIDRTTYEDLLVHHKVEVLDIKRGVGWHKSNGFNNKINALVTKMFDKRLEAQKNKNVALSTCLKLYINSLYGKLLLCDTEYKIKYVRGKEKFESYVCNNYNAIKSIKNIDHKCDIQDRYRIKYSKGVMGNYNYAHLGMSILSESKRIVNEVLGVANDNNIDIYMTDTDSIHMLQKDVQILGDKFREKYGRELIGKYMGQFHTDFESQNIEGPVWSKKFIGLGKKAYLDILTNSKGEEDYHIRFKGAHSSNIINYCKNNNMSVEDFYMKLYNGMPLTLDICDGKVRFEFEDAQIRTKKTMIKKFDFIDPEAKKLYFYNLKY